MHTKKMKCLIIQQPQRVFLEFILFLKYKYVSRETFVLVTHETNKMTKTKRRSLGDLGENLACKFLMKHGYKIVERNYLKKWGEIDIIASKKNRLHFVEVKTVSRNLNVSRETNDTYNPEENIHPWKLQRLSRTIQSYLLENDWEGDWQLDAITVLVDSEHKKARVSIIENVIL